MYQSDLPIGNGYYVQEAQAPNLYVRNTEDRYSFKFQYTTDKEAVVKFNHTFKNDHVNAKINLVKKDAKTGSTPQGDATLKGAVYGLYYILMKYIKINAVATAVSIIVGVLVYAISLLLLRGLNEEDLKMFPKGHLMIRLAKKLHLLKK